MSRRSPTATVSPTDVLVSSASAPALFPARPTIAALSERDITRLTNLELEEELSRGFLDEYLQYAKENKGYKEFLQSLTKEVENLEGEEKKAILDNNLKNLDVSLQGILVDDSGKFLQDDFEDILNIFYKKTPISRSTTLFALKLRPEVESSENRARFFSKLFGNFDELIDSSKTLEDLERNLSVASRSASEAEKAIANLLIRFLNNNKANPIPFSFIKYALTCETALIKDQLSVIRTKPIIDNYSMKKYPYSNRCFSREENITTRQFGKLKEKRCSAQHFARKEKEFPIEVIKEQVEALISGGLNYALSNPAVRRFESKIDGVTIEETLSSSQLDALEAVDRALKRRGKAEIRIATGGGKTFLSELITREYIGEKTGITSVINLNLHSKPEQFQAIQSASSDFTNQLVILDEAFFYGDYFKSSLTGGADFDGIEVQNLRNQMIRNLRQRGATVIVMGASESLEKMDIEIARQNKKVQEKDDKLAVLNEELADSSAQAEYLINIKNKIDKFASNYAMKIKSSQWSDMSPDVKKKEIKTLKKFIKSLIDFAKDERNVGAFNVLQAEIMQDAYELATKEGGGFNSTAVCLIYAVLGKFSAANMTVRMPVEARKNGEAWPEDYYSKIRGLTRSSDSITFIAEKIREAEVIVEDKKIKITRAKSGSKEGKIKLKAKKRQRADIAKRRDERTQEKVGDAEFASINIAYEGIRSLSQTTAEHIPRLDAGTRLQYILPDYKIDEELASNDDIARVAQNTDAQIILLPWEIDGKLGCKIYENGVISEVKLADLKEFLASSSLNSKTRLISFFDERKVIGGDDESASTLITNQIIHLPSSAGVTNNRLMQYIGRNRDPDDKAKLKIVINEDISKGEFIEIVEKNTKQDDYNHAVGFLNVKSRAKTGAKKEFYQQDLVKKGLLVETDATRERKKEAERVERAEISRIVRTGLQELELCVKEIKEKDVQNDTYFADLKTQFTVQEGLLNLEELEGANITRIIDAIAEYKELYSGAMESKSDLSSRAQGKVTELENLITSTLEKLKDENISISELRNLRNDFQVESLFTFSSETSEIIDSFDQLQSIVSLDLINDTVEEIRNEAQAIIEECTKNITENIDQISNNIKDLEDAIKHLNLKKNQFELESSKVIGDLNNLLDEPVLEVLKNNNNSNIEELEAKINQNILVLEGKKVELEKFAKEFETYEASTPIQATKDKKRVLLFNSQSSEEVRKNLADFYRLNQSKEAEKSFGIAVKQSVAKQIEVYKQRILQEISQVEQEFKESAASIDELEAQVNAKKQEALKNLSVIKNIEKARFDSTLKLIETEIIEKRQKNDRLKEQQISKLQNFVTRAGGMSLVDDISEMMEIMSAKKVQVEELMNLKVKRTVGIADTSSDLDLSRIDQAAEKDLTAARIIIDSAKESCDGIESQIQEIREKISKSEKEFEEKRRQEQKKLRDKKQEYQVSLLRAGFLAEDLGWLDDSLEQIDQAVNRQSPEYRELEQNMKAQHDLLVRNRKLVEKETSDMNEIQGVIKSNAVLVEELTKINFLSTAFLEANLDAIEVQVAAKIQEAQGKKEVVSKAIKAIINKTATMLTEAEDSRDASEQKYNTQIANNRAKREIINQKIVDAELEDNYPETMDEIDQQLKSANDAKDKEIAQRKADIEEKRTALRAKLQGIEDANLQEVTKILTESQTISLELDGFTRIGTIADFNFDNVEVEVDAAILEKVGAQQRALVVKIRELQEFVQRSKIVQEEMARKLGDKLKKIEKFEESVAKKEGEIKNKEELQDQLQSLKDEIAQKKLLVEDQIKDSKDAEGALELIITQAGPAQDMVNLQRVIEVLKEVAKSEEIINNRAQKIAKFEEEYESLEESSLQEIIDNDVDISKAKEKTEAGQKITRWVNDIEQKRKAKKLDEIETNAKETFKGVISSLNSQNQEMQRLKEQSAMGLEDVNIGAEEEVIKKPVIKIPPLDLKAVKEETQRRLNHSHSKIGRMYADLQDPFQVAERVFGHKVQSLEDSVGIEGGTVTIFRAFCKAIEQFDLNDTAAEYWDKLSSNSQKTAVISFLHQRQDGKMNLFDRKTKQNYSLEEMDDTTRRQFEEAFGFIKEDCAQVQTFIEVTRKQIPSFSINAYETTKLSQQNLQENAGGR